MPIGHYEKNFTLRMEAVVSSETSIIHELSTRHHIPEDCVTEQVKSSEVYVGYDLEITRG